MSYPVSGRTPGALSTTHGSESSSGISSIPSRSSDPTPTQSSFAPNYGRTPSVHFADEVMTQQTSDGSHLASLVVQSLNVTQNRLAISGQSSAVTPGTGGVVQFMSYGNDTQNSKAFYIDYIIINSTCIIGSGTF